MYWYCLQSAIVHVRVLAGGNSISFMFSIYLYISLCQVGIGQVDYSNNKAKLKLRDAHLESIFHHVLRARVTHKHHRPRIEFEQED